MKNILCFGYSNTWGYIPGTGERFDFDTRWTGVLQNLTEGEFRIIEEGLNGRTTIRSEQERAFRSGAELLPVLLESHSPIDLLVIMLGTNDLKKRFEDSAKDIAVHAGQLCRLAYSVERFVASAGQILLISPSLVVEIADEEALVFDGAMDKSKALSVNYKAIAEELGVYFFDACSAVTTTDEDGIHWNAKQHYDFAIQLEPAIRKIVG